MSKNAIKSNDSANPDYGVAPKKSWLGHIVAIVAGTVVALLTIYLSYTRLKQPQISLDWAALIFSGLTTGIITFFVVWGHFQKPDAD